MTILANHGLSILDMTKNFSDSNTESITSILIKREVEANLLREAFVSKKTEG
jgi:hypothetical protein